MELKQELGGYGERRLVTMGRRLSIGRRSMTLFSSRKLSASHSLFFSRFPDVFLLATMTMTKRTKRRMANQMDSPASLLKAKSRQNPMKHDHQRQSKRNRQGSYTYIAWKS
jgi:hypothetical protein